MKHTLVLTGLLFFVVVTASAQGNRWIAVKALPKGTELIIERKKSDRVVGYVTAVDDRTVSVTSNSGSFAIDKDNVSKIFYAIPRDKMKHANRGALIGMIGGLVAGVALSATQSSDSESMPYVGTFIAGGLLGGWIGAKHGGGKQKGSLIYSAN